MALVKEGLLNELVEGIRLIPDLSMARAMKILEKHKVPYPMKVATELCLLIRKIQIDYDLDDELVLGSLRKDFKRILQRGMG